jgi:putative tricarboxylic transport membrane protein
LRIPAHLLALGILVMCVVGSFAIRNTLFDVIAMLTVGFVGYLLGRARIPVAPVLLGLVLGPTLEREVRTALVMSEGSYSIFFDSAPSLFFLGLAVLIIVGQALGSFRTRKAQQQEA